jgi:hypothetical protein
LSRAAAHLNDAGITLYRDGRIVYREPGFAFLDEQRLATGKEAFDHARINPRRIQHRYWANLASSPLTDRRFSHLSAADLVSRQVEQMWRAGGGATDLVLAVPPYMTAGNLGLLLGIAAELSIPVVAMVDAAVAATRREYRNAVPVHIDISLHATTLTRLAQPGHVQLDRVEIIEDCGIHALSDTWLNTIAEAFVQQSRFDPLHTAATEQMLFGKLAGWLEEAARSDRVHVMLEYGGIAHQAEIESLALIGAAAPYYQRIASKLRPLFRAEDTPAIQVTDRVARLPGLADMLKARVGGELFVLEPGATAHGALMRCRDLPQGRGGEGPISLRRQLPWDQSAVAVKSDLASRAGVGMPTHLLFGSRAYVIDGAPLVLGTQPSDTERSIVLAPDMPGISRRHCLFRRQNGQCVLEDHSRYGTFLNGHRIDGSTVLQVGDSVRVGAPGFEFLLITTDTADGT